MCDKQEFVHLHNHSDISIQDALAKPKALAKKAREMGFPAAAITDHGRMGGVIDFVEGCRVPNDKYAPIKPLIGVEVYTTADMLVKENVRILADGTAVKGRPKHNHLTLIAQNSTGYRNLLNIASEGAEKGFYYDPRVDWSVIKRHSEGVIALSGCLASETSQALMREDVAGAEAIMHRFKEAFGSNYYIELQNHGIPEQQAILPKLLDLSRRLEIPTVASNDVHYLEAEDWKVHDILIQMRDLADDRKVGKNKGGKKEAYSSHQFWLKSEAEMRAIFGSAAPESLANTLRLAETVEDFLKLDVPHLLPSVPIPTDDVDFMAFKQTHLPFHPMNDAYLAHLAMRGLKELGLDKKADYVARLRYELSVIWYMGVTDYFLIQREMVEFMRSKDILYGIRGSGVGSLVNHCLKVCPVDPIRWSLMFERFLNPGRGTQYKIDCSCHPLKQWRADNPSVDQRAALARLKALLEEKSRESEYRPHRPDMMKELWVLENQELSAYICDLADRHLTTSSNESQLWSAYFLGIAVDRPESSLIVSKVATLPDVDTDIDDRRRGEVIDWARNRFGPEHVAMIGTRGTYQAKAAVMNTLKVSEKFQSKWGDRVPQRAVDISKTIPVRQQPPMTIEDAIQLSSEFAAFARQYPDEVETARRLVGVISHLGVHAGGVLICSEPIHNHAPIENSRGTLCSAYDMMSVERVGLVKYDLLGLATYQMVSRCLALIRKRRGPQVAPDMEKIDLDDKRVFSLYASGKTSSVFQFASYGMQRACKEVRVDNLKDVIAIAALYRPGPMEFIPDYAEGKRNPSSVIYKHPLIKKHLGVTYGVGAFQESIMFLVQDMTHLSWLDLEKLRKAISKKQGKEFDAVCAHFKTKALANDMPVEAVDEVLRLTAKFGGYAFNLSHATAYGILSYWTAYLRYHFTPEWMAACIQVDQGDENKLALYLGECRDERLTVQRANVNESGTETVVTPDGRIILPLTSIKGVGVLVQEIVDQQPFKSFFDMVERARPNRGMIEALLQAGALDCFPEMKVRTAVNEYAEAMELFDGAVAECKRREKEAARQAKMSYKQDLFLDDEQPNREDTEYVMPILRRPAPPPERKKLHRIMGFDRNKALKDFRL